MSKHQPSKNAEASPEAPAPSPERISIRLQRISQMHAATKDQAWKLKLAVFFMGMEVQALKAELGVSQGGDRANQNGFALLGKNYATWEELIEREAGITSQTARNYVTAYENICQVAPDVVNRILRLASPTIDRIEGKTPLALPDAEGVIQTIPEKDLVAFREAVDPWGLSQLYQKVLKPAQAQIIEEATKTQARLSEQQALLKFWFEDFDSRMQKRDYLKIPPKQRELLLNSLEVVTKEIRDSLRKTSK